MNNELVEKLKNCGTKKSEIEKQLGMPKNSLSGMLSGAKPIPKRWEEKLQDFLDGKIEESPATTTEILIAEKVVEKPSIGIKGVTLGSELIKSMPKTAFQLILAEFNNLVLEQPPIKEVKAQLEKIRVKADNPELNYRQKEAVIARVDNYLNGTYGTSFNENNAHKNH